MQTKKQGFTLIELLVVIVIIGILATIAIPQFTSYFAKARDSERKAAVSNIATIVKVNQATSDTIDYSVADETALSTVLSGQGYAMPTGTSGGKCYVYGELTATDDEFFIAAGLEETAGTIAVSGTGDGVTAANANALKAAIADDWAGACTTEPGALTTADNTYTYVSF